MKLYLRTYFGEPKVLYSGTMIDTFQGLCQVNRGAPSGWFMMGYIMIIYLKKKVHGVEIKKAITGDDFKLVTMIFVDGD